MDLNLKDKVALVTGGSHGIGAAICRSLAEEGCQIFYCARGVRYDMNTVCEEIREINRLKIETGRVGYAVCDYRTADISTEARAHFIVDEAVRTFGHVDILINNLGGGGRWGNINKWEETPTRVWEETIMHNYLTTMWFTNKLLPLMEKQKFGRVIAISSVYGMERGGAPWFSAAKSAQTAAMKCYSGNTKFAEQGITFNTVCPGYIDVKKQDKEVVVWGENKTIPVGRYGTSEEVAPLVTFLCSEKASYINGATITIDGGFTKSF